MPIRGRSRQARLKREHWIVGFASELVRVRPRWTTAAARSLACSQWAQRSLQSPVVAARSWIGSQVWTAFEASAFGDDPEEFDHASAGAPGAVNH